MKQLRTAIGYFYTRYSFYPVFTGFAVASLAGFLTRETVWLANGGLGTMTSLSLTVWLLIFAGATLLAFLPPKFLWPLVTYGAWFCYAIPMLCANHSNVWMLAALLFLMALLTYFVLRDTKALFTESNSLMRMRIPYEKPIFAVLIALLSLASVLLLAIIGVYRYLSYYSPCFDFGIFAQMFESMRTTFLPTTTCERYTELSHFAVHLSPIYYVLLPLYCIFPSPITLAISQALIVGSSVIPLALIARRMNFTRWQTVAIGVCIAFFPALHGGTFYDIHENCFLTPLLLWFFYFLERNSHVGMVLTALSVCLVKEDAAVYIAFIALYLIFSGRKKLFGTGLLVLAIGYFLFAVTMLANFGEGAMNWRYQNLMLAGEDSLVSVVVNVFKNPAYALSGSFNAEKVEFLLQLLLPMAGTALLIKRADRIILLGPVVLITLLSDYVYQHSIYFQYNFGIIAILFYLALLNLRDLSDRWRQYLVICMAVASILSYAALCSPYLSVTDAYESNAEAIEIYNEAVEQVDRDRSVAATTFFVPHLYDCKELYEVKSDSDAEQILLMTDGEEGQRYYATFLQRGYTVAWEEEGVAALLIKAGE
ncbi:MAG: DUF2079 domain-containing protein [Clostridia bacterium]|nr:DUF2079 domain-containing protein [Clostridia bacterium]